MRPQPVRPPASGSAASSRRGAGRSRRHRHFLRRPCDGRVGAGGHRGRGHRGPVAGCRAAQGARFRRGWGRGALELIGGMLSTGHRDCCAQVGIRSVVLEKGSALREEGAAIGLWNNAWKALEALEVADALRPGYLPLSRCAAGWAELGWAGLAGIGWLGWLGWVQQSDGVERHQAHAGVGEGLGAGGHLPEHLGGVGAAEHGQLPHGPVAVVLDGAGGQCVGFVGILCQLQSLHRGQGQLGCMPASSSPHPNMNLPGIRRTRRPCARCCRWRCRRCWRRQTPGRGPWAGEEEGASCGLDDPVTSQVLSILAPAAQGGAVPQHRQDAQGLQLCRVRRRQRPGV